MKQYNTLQEFVKQNEVTGASDMFLTKLNSIPSIIVKSEKFEKGSDLICASRGVQKSGVLKEGMTIMDLKDRAVWTIELKEGGTRHKFVGDPVPIKDIPAEFLK